MSEVIAAISTAPFAGGIGVIRISGDEAIEVADRVFRSCDGVRLSEIGGYRAKFGHVYDENEKIDQCVATVFRAPHSYTGENVVELSCHGGVFIVWAVLQAVLKSGASPAQAGEFTKRAFLNGKMDLTAAESVMNIISAQGEAMARASLGALEGNLYKKIKEVLSSLLDCSATMAAWVDYPDEEIPELEENELSQTLESAAQKLKKLIDGYSQGQAIIEGIETAIVGRPNAGKSTLMNLLAGKEKSIVTSIPGTTRDVVEETVRLGNLVLRLSDTAGLRQSDDTVEAIGVQRAYNMIEKAQLIFAVFDSSVSLCDEDKKLIEMCKGRPCVGIINKSDLPTQADVEYIRSMLENTVFISAHDDSSLDTLVAVTEKIVGTDTFSPNEPLIANARQKNCCTAAYDLIVQAKQALDDMMTYDAINVLIDCAVDELLDLTGEKATDAVVERVFENFCVGK